MAASRVATGGGALSARPKKVGNAGLGGKPLNEEYCTPAAPCQ